MILIICLSVKTLKDYISTFNAPFSNLKNNNAIENNDTQKSDISQVAEQVFEALNHKMTLNKETFIHRFHSFIDANISDSFYKMPATPEGRKRELGRAGWVLLHNIAMKYPHLPSDEQKNDISQFLNLFGKLFPCSECRPHFKKMVSENPPDFSSNIKFNSWLNRVHNIVNRRIGNQEFDVKRLDDRWDCGCKLDSFE